MVKDEGAANGPGLDKEKARNDLKSDVEVGQIFDRPENGNHAAQELLRVRLRGGRQAAGVDHIDHDGAFPLPNHRSVTAAEVQMGKQWSARLDIAIPPLEEQILCEIFGSLPIVA